MDGDYKFINKEEKQLVNLYRNGKFLKEVVFNQDATYPDTQSLKGMAIRYANRQQKLKNEKKSEHNREKKQCRCKAINDESQQCKNDALGTSTHPYTCSQHTDILGFYTHVTALNRCENFFYRPRCLRQADRGSALCRVCATNPYRENLQTPFPEVNLDEELEYVNILTPEELQRSLKSAVDKIVLYSIANPNAHFYVGCSVSPGEIRHQHKNELPITMTFHDLHVFISKKHALWLENALTKEFKTNPLLKGKLHNKVEGGQDNSSEENDVHVVYLGIVQKELALHRTASVNIPAVKQTIESTSKVDLADLAAILDVTLVTDFPSTTTLGLIKFFGL